MMKCLIYETTWGKHQKIFESWKKTSPVMSGGGSFHLYKKHIWGIGSAGQAQYQHKMATNKNLTAMTN